MFCLFDQDGDEGIQDRILGAITTDFCNAISTHQPIICSYSILYNFAKRTHYPNHPQHQENHALKCFSINAKEWHLFHIPDSQVFLLYPKGSSQFIRINRNIPHARLVMHPTNLEPIYLLDPQGFSQLTDSRNTYLEFLKIFSGIKLTDLTNLTSTLPHDDNDNDYSRLILWMNQNRLYKNIRIQHSDLEKIFLKNEDLPQIFQDTLIKNEWIFFFSGHGEIDSYIAGCPDYEWEFILRFLNSLETKLVFLATCMLGESNLSFLNSTINLEDMFFKFDLVSGALTDAPVGGSPNFEAFVQQTTISHLSPEKLPDVLLPLSDILPETRAIHSTTRIPLVMHAGECEFKVCPLVPAIKFFTTENLETKPQIELDENTLTAIFTTCTVQKPINVSLTSLKNIFEHIPKSGPTQFERCFCFDQIIPYFIELSKKQWTQFPSAYQLYHENDEILPIYQAHRELIAYKLVYPAFTSKTKNFYDHTNYIDRRKPTKTINKFCTINVGNTFEARVIPEFGVLTFIRDAFFDIAARFSHRTFLIENLTGNNDISLILQLLEERYPTVRAHPHPLRQLLTGKENQQITLQNVIIQTATPIHDQVYVHLSFQCGPTAWKLSYQVNPSICDHRTCWNFEQQNLVQHQEKFTKMNAQC